MDDFDGKYLDTCKLVLDEINNALTSADIASIEKLTDDVCKADKVFLIGVGRVMMSLEAFAKRLSHLGIDANCVGDITEPAITDKDILIVGSGSGESIVPVAIAKKAKSLGAKVIHIGSNPNGSMKDYCDYMVRIPVRTRLYLEDEIDSKQIMTSLFEQSLLILGDVIAKMIVDERKIDLRELWQYHANLE
jgi:6-phospho-3-hexuloisomerase